MSTVEISKEERDSWRFEATDECGTPSEEDERILRLLNALEVTELLLDGSVQETRANFSAVYQACTEIIPDLKAKLADAEAENARLTKMVDWLAEKMADISDKMNSPNAPAYCVACNICPVDGNDMEGHTCLDAIEEAARRVVADSEVKG